MSGWTIEIASDPQQDVETAVIKRVDADINCALVVFASGRKEWLDLSLSSFKVVVEPTVSPSSMPPSPAREPSHSIRMPTINLIQDDTDHDVGPAEAPEPAKPDAHSVTSPLKQHQPFVIVQESDSEPATDVTSFDWYAEGSFVELCDPHGEFLEGAVMCSKAETTLQLYNEKRQFFSIDTLRQAFKVVIHGLVALKSIPMGQSIEVYSAMLGQFCRAMVLKPAHLGRLVPIRLESGSVDWLDLTSQTFKLVFLAHTAKPKEALQKSLRATLSPDKRLARRHSHNMAHANHHNHFTHHHHHHQTKQQLGLEFPVLRLGQRVDIYDPELRRFAQFRVLTMSPVVAHEYEFESMDETLVGDVDEPPESFTGNLTRLQCLIPLQPAQWEAYITVLHGHQLEILDSDTQSVMLGTIKAIMADGDTDPSVLVGFSDGSKQWIDVQTKTVRLRLNGGDTEMDEEISEAAERWGFDPEASGTRLSNRRKLSILGSRSALFRRNSDIPEEEKDAMTAVAADPTLTRVASLPSHPAVQTLDFSQLIKGVPLGEVVTSLPGADASQSPLSAKLSGRLPVGPIEAVRVLNDQASTLT